MTTQGLASLRMRAMASAIVLFVLNLIGLEDLDRSAERDRER